MRCSGVNEGEAAPAGCPTSNSLWGTEPQRIHWLGGKRVQRLFPVNAGAQQHAAGPLAVAALGPVALITLEGGLTPPERQSVTHLLR